MSGYANISAVPDQNILYNAASGATLLTNQRNQLLNQYDQQTLPYRVQEEQQKVGGADMTAVGQASQALLNNYGDEASRAAAYPGIVADLQRQGFAKNAPSVYPGEAALKTIIGRSLSVEQQYNLGMATNPEWTRQFQQLYGGGAGAPGGGGDPVSGMPVEKALPALAQRESGNQNIDTQIKGADGKPASTASGPYQMLDTTFQEGMRLAGIPGTWTHAKDAPREVQDAAASAIYQKYGATPWAASNPNRGKQTVAATAPAAAPGAPPAASSIVQGQPGDTTAPPPPGGSGAAYTGGVGTALNRLALPVPPVPPSGAVIKGSPIPSGKTADAIVAGMQLARATPMPPTALTAGTAGAPGAPTVTAPASAPTPQAGWGTGGATSYSDSPTIPTPPPNAMGPGGKNGPPAAVAAPSAAPAAQPPPAQPPGQQQVPGQPNLPRRADVPTGVQTPQFQQAQALLARAAQAKALAAQMPPNSPMARQIAVAAARDEQLAASLQQQDNIVQTQEGQLNTRTGEMKDPTKPLPVWKFDPNAAGGAGAWIDTSGGGAKPEPVPAQRAEAVAQKDVMELGPLVANGTATPEQKARYDVAAETYRQPTLRENPVTKETVKVYQRDLPPGFPSSSSAVGGGGSAATGGGPQVVMPGLSPAQQQVARDPAAYKVAESQYDRDSKEIAAIGDAGRSAQADQIRIREMQDVLQRFSSGPGTEARTAAAAWLQRWLPAGLTGWQKESANLSGSDAAQAFSKLALTGAGQQERGVLGNRGGYQAISLFQKANPNVDLQDATNKSILDMQLISNQANQDYSQSALGHFADNEKKFSTTHQYDSLAQFDRNWNAQRNPEVYAAAMGAVSGQPASQWARGLSDDEYARALQIVQRAKPSAVVQTKSGPYSMQPNAVTSGTQPKSGDTVIRFDHNGNRIQ